MSLLAAVAAATLLARMEALNTNLHTFTATLHAHVVMKTLPFLTANLVGAYYYQEPDKNRIVFISGMPLAMPLVGQQLDKLTAHIEKPSQWRELYTVTIVADDGKSTRFKLVPRKPGNIDSIDAKADDTSALVTSMRWNYSNGGYAEVTNHYVRLDGDWVVEAQDGHVQEPGYVADITSTIDNYKLNTPLPDGIFENK